MESPTKVVTSAYLARASRAASPWGSPRLPKGIVLGHLAQNLVACRPPGNRGVEGIDAPDGYAQLLQSGRGVEYSKLVAMEGDPVLGHDGLGELGDGLVRVFLDGGLGVGARFLISSEMA